MICCLKLKALILLLVCIIYILYTLSCVVLMFLSCISILTHDIDIANLSVCLSVRLSVCYVPVPDENGLTYCHSFFIIRQPNHSSFTSIKYSDGVTTCGALNTGGVEKIRDFLPISRYISRKRYKISPQLLWKSNGNQYAIYQMVPFPMTLNEP